MCVKAAAQPLADLSSTPLSKCLAKELGLLQEITKGTEEDWAPHHAEAACGPVAMHYHFFQLHLESGGASSLDRCCAFTTLGENNIGLTIIGFPATPRHQYCKTEK